MLIFPLVTFLNRVKSGLLRRFDHIMCIQYCRTKGVCFVPKHTRFDGRAVLKFHPGSRIEIGPHFRCVSSKQIGMENSVCSKIVVHGDGRLCIGHHTGMTNSTINCHESITIGNYVNIGAGCVIADSDFHSLDWRDRMDDTDITKKRNAPVVIKDLAFIGMHSIILKGVTIGEKSIIGAGSVVSRCVPDGEIWAGNPARFVKKAIE